jgi:hypothetical protein
MCGVGYVYDTAADNYVCELTGTTFGCNVDSNGEADKETCCNCDAGYTGTPCTFDCTAATCTSPSVATVNLGNTGCDCVCPAGQTCLPTCADTNSDGVADDWFTCNPGGGYYGLLDPVLTSTCTADPCTEVECCNPNPLTCADTNQDGTTDDAFSCGVGSLVAKNPVPTTECASNPCGAAECVVFFYAQHSCGC